MTRINLARAHTFPRVSVFTLTSVPEKRSLCARETAQARRAQRSLTHIEAKLQRFVRRIDKKSEVSVMLRQSIRNHNTRQKIRSAKNASQLKRIVEISPQKT